MKTFSIIVPVYYNELNLSDTIPCLINLKNNILDYYLELVFVDDDSGDNVHVFVNGVNSPHTFFKECFKNVNELEPV